MLLAGCNESKIAKVIVIYYKSPFYSANRLMSATCNVENSTSTCSISYSPASRLMSATCNVDIRTSTCIISYSPANKLMSAMART